MWRHLRHPLPVRITNSPASKLMALVVVLIVPGGLMLPLCYAAYAAVVHSATRRALGRHGRMVASRDSWGAPE